MRLAKWIALTDTKPKTFAAKLGKHRATVYKYLTGASRPTIKTMDRIAKMTRGDVRREDWR